MLRKSLPFQKVTHNISKIDAQPSSLSQASLIVLVIGQLMVRLISQIFRSSIHLGCYRWTMVNTHVNSVRYSTAFAEAFWKDSAMTVGWMPFCNIFSAAPRRLPARTTTDVVPSPASTSCAAERSTSWPTVKLLFEYIYI